MAGIAKKDVHQYLSEPSSYLFIAGFIAVVGYSFASSAAITGSSGAAGLFTGMTGVLLPLFPIITKNAFSDEKRAGTYLILLSSPVSTFSIVMGKFLASMALFLMAMICSLVFGLMLMIMGISTVGELFAIYTGTLLLGSCYIALGIFIASLCDRSLHGWMFTLACLAILRFIYIISPYSTDAAIGTLLSVFGLFDSFDTFRMGLLALTPAIYMLSFIVFFLFMACKVVDKRKWGKGDAI